MRKIKKKILIFTRCAWTYNNFRKEFTEYLSKKNYEIHVGLDISNEKLKIKKNIKFYDIPFLNKGNSYIKNLIILLKIFRLIKIVNPALIHNFTARPNYFVTSLNFFNKKIIINSITGFGHLSLSLNQIKKLFWIKILFFILFRSNFIIVQNKNDRILLKSIKFKNVKIIFPNIKPSIKNKKIKKKKNNQVIFLMYSRIIKEKGVIEYLKCAKELSKNNECKFYLIGDPDFNNPTSIDIETIKKYINKNIIYLKHTDKIYKYILKSDVIVLPSYREGLPASLLEALYFKKPVITTNVPGCKECIKNNYNGFLIPARNHKSLILAMKKYLNNKEIIKKHSLNSFRLYLKKFDSNANLKYEKVYRKLLNEKSSCPTIK